MTDDDRGAYSLFGSATDLELPVGTSLLVSAPEPAGREVVLRALVEGLAAGEGVLAITTDDPAGDITEQVREMAGDPDLELAETMRVIDCQTDQLAVEDESVVAQDVNSPRSLTDIGIGFKNAFDEFEAGGVDRVRFGLLSLSILLTYVDRETCYRFCQTLTRALGQEEALGLFMLNAYAHDDETVDTLRRAFDGMAQVETDGEGFSVRLVGLDGVPEGPYTLSVTPG